MDGQTLAALVQAGIPTFAMEGVDAETTEWEVQRSRLVNSPPAVLLIAAILTRFNVFDPPFYWDA